MRLILIGLSRILLNVIASLSLLWDFCIIELVPPRAVSVLCVRGYSAGAGVIAHAMAHMKAASSRAVAVITVFLFFPRARSFLNRLQSLT